MSDPSPSRRTTTNKQTLQAHRSLRERNPKAFWMAMILAGILLMGPVTALLSLILS
jgi:hypothetical protein